ncbi:hypothetical protein [Tenuifilum osseticum]|uniref:hypothetical protein n=1 Tax=Tenuifilum TaxID=2760873 RepID=UPI0030B7B041
MEKNSLEYQLDELNTRIALHKHKMEITVTSFEEYLKLKDQLNRMLIKRISLEQRVKRTRTHYRPRVYEPDIVICHDEL